jgi:hypothetical protein
MTSIAFAIVGAIVGVVSSSLGVIWSAIKSRSHQKAIEQREQREQHGQIDVKLSGGRSISINIGSATPDELVNFIDEIKGGSADSVGNSDRPAEP